MVAKKPKTKIVKSDPLKEFSESALNLLRLMGTQASLEVSEDKANDTLLVNINGGEETGLLIGNRGRTLNSIQVLLGLIYKTKVGEWKRILVDVSDWREKETSRLTQLAIHTAERAKETGEAQSLYNLTAAQRRVVHLTLGEDKDIETESQGEGINRFLVVRPKK
jgi:spoIIIJ-associated protein